jgi:hypothetical protein
MSFLWESEHLVNGRIFLFRRVVFRTVVSKGGGGREIASCIVHGIWVYNGELVYGEEE